MNKVIQTLLTWFLIAFLAIVIPAVVFSQTFPVPQAASAVDPLAGAPVVFEGETLFVIKSSFGSISAQQRQQKAEQRIAEFARN